MAAATRVVINGQAVDRLFASEQGPVAKYLLRKGTQVESAAIRLCPVDTGRLRASVVMILTRDGIGLVVYVGTNVVYAKYVELGTRFSPAQPFLRPALRAAA